MSSLLKSDIAEVIDYAYQALRDNNAEFLAEMMVTLEDLNTGIHSKTASDLLSLSRSYGLEACTAYLETIQTHLFDYSGAIEYALSHRLFNPILLMQEHGREKFTDSLADVLDVRLTLKKISPRFALKLIDHLTLETLSLLMKDERLFEFDVIDNDMLNFLGVSTQSEMIKTDGHHHFEKIYQAYTMIDNTDRTLSLWRWVYAFGVRCEAPIAQLENLINEFLSNYIGVHPQSLQSLFYSYGKINVTNYALCAHILRTASKLVENHTLTHELARNIFELINPSLSEENSDELSYDRNFADTVGLFVKSLAKKKELYSVFFNCLFDAICFPNRPRSSMIIAAVVTELNSINVDFDTLNPASKKKMVDIEGSFFYLIFGRDVYHQEMNDTVIALLPVCGNYLTEVTFEKSGVDSWKAYYLKILPDLDTNQFNYLTLNYLDSIPLNDALAEDMIHNYFTLAHLSKRFSLTEMLDAAQSDAVREMLLETLTK